MKLPKFVKIGQQFDNTRILPEQIHDVVWQQLGMSQIAATIKPGMSVCLTCGSRGIDNIVAITRSVAEFCK